MPDESIDDILFQMDYWINDLKKIELSLLK
jgi:hypothetical protein